MASNEALTPEQLAEDFNAIVQAINEAGEQFRWHAEWFERLRRHNPGKHESMLVTLDQLDARGKGSKKEQAEAQLRIAENLDDRGWRSFTQMLEPRKAFLDPQEALTKALISAIGNPNETGVDPTLDNYDHSTEHTPVFVQTKGVPLIPKGGRNPRGVVEAAGRIINWSANELYGYPRGITALVVWDGKWRTHLQMGQRCDENPDHYKNLVFLPYVAGCELPAPNELLPVDALGTEYTD